MPGARYRVLQRISLAGILLDPAGGDDIFEYNGNAVIINGMAHQISPDVIGTLIQHGRIEAIPVTPTIPLVDANTANALWSKCKPFRVLLEKSGRKWGIEYDGTPNGNVMIQPWGSRPHYPKDINDAVDKIWRKRGLGFTYAPGTRDTVPGPPLKVKLEGPYAEIRTIRQVGDDNYEALDEKGNLLLHLDEKGANAVADADPFRVVLVGD